MLKWKNMDLNSKEVTGWVLSVFGGMAFGILIIVLINLLKKNDKE